MKRTFPAKVIEEEQRVIMTTAAAQAPARAPAAPVSTFAAGLAAGRAGGSAEDVRRAIAEIADLVAEREA